MGDMALLLLYLLLALGVSFLCSVLEAVLLSITPSYIALKQKEGGHVGERLDSLKSDIDRPLSALLSLNTIAHTIGAAGVGAQSQQVFGNGYLTATSIVLTLLILVISEIIPKTLGANYWKQLAPTAALLLQWMNKALYPLVNKRFYFQEAELIDHDRRGSARLRLLNDLSEDWKTGAELDGQFVQFDDYLLSLVSIPALSSAR